MQSSSNVNTAPAASPAPPTMSVATIGNRQVNGGRFDFDDGGTYCGGWEDGKAHGHGVCTGPKGQGEYSGSWHYGFEVSGVYTWPSGSTYEGHWQNGKRHGLGLELRGRWLYRGEWTQGFKGRYGVRQSTTSTAKYEGTWANGLQDGYGSETYADGGTYQGQWLRGMRHGYGVRTSAAFGMASHYKPKSSLRASLSSLRSDPPGVAADPAAERDKRLDDGRGGFVLKAKSDEAPVRRRSFSERSSNIKKSILQGLKLKKQHSTGELEKRGTSASIRSTGSSASWMSTESSQSGFTHGSHHTDSNASFVVEDDQLDASVTETYMGEWKNDKRAGFGISERSDGLKYEGEWFNNKKYGYGVTTFKDGTKEEGKYKNNVLITSQKKKHLFLIRSAKFRERIDAAVSAAQRASKIALQKADIAISRTATARGKAEQADVASLHSREDSEIARLIAKQLAPDFHQPGSEALKAQLAGRGALADMSRLTLPLSQPKDEANGATNRNKSLYAKHSRDLESVLSSEPSTPENVLGETLRANESSLNRRPSVALGGIRSPNVTDATANGRPAHPGYSSPNSNVAYPYNSTPKTQPDLPNNTMHSAAAIRPSLNTMYDSRDDTDHARMSLAQESMPSGSSASSVNSTLERGRSSLRRGPTISFRDNSYSQPSNHPALNFQQAMNDHFDHYKRPPSRDRSRDSSIDRFSRSSRQSLARQIGPSMGPQPSVGFTNREQSLSRGQSPAPATFATQQRSASRQRTPFHLNPSTALPARTPDSGLSESLDNSEESPSSTVGKEFGGHRRTMSKDLTNSPGNGSIPGLFPVGGMASNPVEEMLLRQRLGQEIPPTANLPKRTESLYLSPAKRQASKAAPAPPPPRKKSLPDSQAAAAAAAAAAALLSREEASVLSSQRREEIRRYMEEQERYRANPLLYIFNPHVKEWLVRKQFTIIILLLNLSLAYMFFKLLT